MKWKINFLSPDKKKKEIGILNEDTNEIKAVQDRVFKIDEVDKTTIIKFEQIPIKPKE